MREERDQLLKAFAEKDAVEGYLARLEIVRSEGTITPENYSSILSDYQVRLSKSTSEIERLKNILSKEAEQIRHDFGIYQFELDRINLRYKVGELSADNFTKTDREIRSALAGFESNLRDLNQLIAARSQADIQLTPPQPSVGASFPLQSAPIPAPQQLVKTPKKSSTMLQAAAIKQPGLKFASPTNLTAMIGGLLLLASVFLLWISPAAKLGEGIDSVSGMSVSIVIGISSIIFGLVVIGAGLLPGKKLKGFVRIAAGGLSVVILLVIVFTGTLPLTSSLVRSVIVMREGFFIYILASVILIATGSLEIVKS